MSCYFTKKFKLTEIATVSLLSLGLLGCGGGGGGSTQASSDNDTALSNDDTSSGNDNEPSENNNTLSGRIITGASSADMSNSWNCGDTEFYFWEDGNGRNSTGGFSVDFTWTADEANNSIAALVMGNQTGLSDVNFMSDTRFTAFDLSDQETIDCTLDAAGGETTPPPMISVPQGIVNGTDASDTQRTVWDCGEGEFFSFWSDENGIRVFDAMVETFVWESQVENTLTVNGEFTAAFFSFEFPTADNWTARDAVSSSGYACDRAPLSALPQLDPNGGNSAPTAEIDQFALSLMVGEVSVIQPNFSDPDSDQLSFFLNTDSQSGFTFDETTGELLLQGVEPGDHTFSIFAFDGQLDKEVTVNVTFTEAIPVVVECPCQISGAQEFLQGRFTNDELSLIRSGGPNGRLLRIVPSFGGGFEPPEMSILVRDNPTQEFPDRACQINTSGGFAFFQDFGSHRASFISVEEAEACVDEVTELANALSGN